MSINYSIGTRDIFVAGRLFAKRAYLSEKSQYWVGERWVLFIEFLREYAYVRKMEDITKQMVMTYAINLLERSIVGEISTQTMRCYLSAVNVLLWFAAPKADRIVHLCKHLGVPRAAPTILFDRGSRYCESLCSTLPARAFALSNLQRQFGLRFEESAKVDARQAWVEACETGQVTITKGTKGGKQRTIPIRNASQQLEALLAAIEFQGTHKSMIPRELTYKIFHSRTYGAAYRRGIKFHDARHKYAQIAYEKLAGWPPPICLQLTKTEHKKFVIKKYGILESVFVKYDRYARISVARELGHERIEISRTYLG